MRNTVKTIGTIEYSYYSRLTGLSTLNNVEDNTLLLESYLPIQKTDQYFLYEVQQGDTLDSIALSKYGSPIYWWIIADYNDMLDCLEPILGTTIKIPELTGVQMR